MESLLIYKGKPSVSQDKWDKASELFPSSNKSSKCKLLKSRAATIRGNRDQGDDIEGAKFENISKYASISIFAV